jgi:hypothetical protein
MWYDVGLYGLETCRGLPETPGNLKKLNKSSPSLALPTCKKTVQGFMLLLAGGLHLPAAAVAGDKVTVPRLLKVLGGEPLHSSNCILEWSICKNILGAFMFNLPVRMWDLVYRGSSDDKTLIHGPVNNQDISNPANYKDPGHSYKASCHSSRPMMP